MCKNLEEACQRPFIEFALYLHDTYNVPLGCDDTINDHDYFLEYGNISNEAGIAWVVCPFCGAPIYALDVSSEYTHWTCPACEFEGAEEDN